MTKKTLTVNDDFGLVCFSNKNFAYRFQRQIMWITFMLFYGAFASFLGLKASVPIHCNCMKRSLQNLFFCAQKEESHTGLE